MFHNIVHWFLKSLKEKSPLFFHLFFFVQGDLGKITIGNPVGLCGKCAWMHGGRGSVVIAGWRADVSNSPMGTTSLDMHPEGWLVKTCWWIWEPIIVGGLPRHPGGSPKQVWGGRSWPSRGPPCCDRKQKCFETFDTNTEFWMCEKICK